MTERFANVETMVEFVKKYTPCINGETTMECVERSIRNAPTIEAKPVVHAHWFLLDDCANEGVYCSACTKKVYKTNYANQKLKSKYCPNCGAQMDEGIKIPVISMEDVPKIMEEMEK